MANVILKNLTKKFKEVAAVNNVNIEIKDKEFPQFSKEKVDYLLKIASDYQSKVDKKVEDSLPKFSRNYWWNRSPSMQVKMKPTCNGFGRAIEELGKDENVNSLGGRYYLFYQNG